MNNSIRKNLKKKDKVIVDSYKGFIIDKFSIKNENETYPNKNLYTVLLENINEEDINRKNKNYNKKTVGTTIFYKTIGNSINKSEIKRETEVYVGPSKLLGTITSISKKNNKKLYNVLVYPVLESHIEKIPEEKIIETKVNIPTRPKMSLSLDLKKNLMKGLTLTKAKINDEKDNFKLGQIIYYENKNLEQDMYIISDFSEDSYTLMDSDGFINDVRKNQIKNLNSLEIILKTEFLNILKKEIESGEFNRNEFIIKYKNVSKFENIDNSSKMLNTIKELNFNNLIKRKERKIKVKNNKISKIEDKKNKPIIRQIKEGELIYNLKNKNKEYIILKKNEYRVQIKSTSNEKIKWIEKKKFFNQYELKENSKENPKVNNYFRHGNIYINKNEKINYTMNPLRGTVLPKSKTFNEKMREYKEYSRELNEENPNSISDFSKETNNYNYNYNGNNERLKTLNPNLKIQNIYGNEIFNNQNNPSIKKVQPNGNISSNGKEINKVQTNGNSSKEKEINKVQPNGNSSNGKEIKKVQPNGNSSSRKEINKVQSNGNSSNGKEINKVQSNGNSSKGKEINKVQSNGNGFNVETNIEEYNSEVEKVPFKINFTKLTPKTYKPIRI